MIDAKLYLQDETIQQQDELQEFNTWYHTQLGSRLKAAILVCRTFISAGISDGARTGKARFDDNTRGAPHSTARLYNKIAFNFTPPPTVGVVATEPSQTPIFASTSTQPSPPSFVQPSSHTNSTTSSRLKSKSLATREKSRYLNWFGYLLALSWIVRPTLAAEDNTTPTPQPGSLWPFNEGPPGLGSFVFAITAAIIIIGCIFSAQRWPHKFEDPALGLLLLVFWTFSSFCIMSDGTTSLTTLLSVGALQVYFGQSFARMRHRMLGYRVPGRRDYTMSVHFWPLIFLLTVLLALLCMKASPTMYNQSTQLPWFPFTIPCFGVAVAVCVYLGYLWKSWDEPLLPRVRVDWSRRGSL